MSRYVFQEDPSSSQLSSCLSNMGIPSPVREDTEQLPQYDSRDNDGLKFTTETGGNTSKATYQEASGAPVEVNSPLGYSVGWVTVVFLNLSKMIGTGVFSTRTYTSTLFGLFDDILTYNSIDGPQGCRLCWSHIVLLGDWIFDGVELSIGLHGIRIVFPQSVWFGGCLLGTVVSPTQILLPHCLCNADGAFLV